ncbi:hypothetical protein [Actinomadura sp. WAC 06369]|uniref:hypothetical protein n=1 Tax=Actinomadura sp. WAC 06369 TaxID=2203193 RepID=UPI0018F71CD0|nr:hypothetical protein [Actinomadura sp. WAC 06369]
MSGTAEREALREHISLFDHAMRLHRQTPDAPLPQDGEPYPDHELHRGERPRRARDQRHVGLDVAAVLDEHFADPVAPPSVLTWAFHDLHVPIHPNEHITAAAFRADRDRVRRTGRWLVRRSPDRCSATVGLALLAADWHDGDIPLVQTIGLLSERFGPLAARALRRRRNGSQALLWLAERADGWGRVYLVEALCETGAGRDWLLRHACDGHFLNGYYAGKVATAAHLQEAITADEADDELIDHTGRLLSILGQCSGMGMTLERYPPARIVLDAFVRHLGRQQPSLRRYLYAANIADHLAQGAPANIGCTDLEHRQLVDRYLSVLNSDDWCTTVRAEADPDSDQIAWFTDTIAERLQLRAFQS